MAKRQKQLAVQLEDALRWYARLSSGGGLGSRAIAFAALTPAKPGEVSRTCLDEIALLTEIWTIPASRMKMGREHRVPLSPAALRLLSALPRFEDNPRVFPDPCGGDMSDMILNAAMKKIHAADLAGGRAGFFDKVSKRPAVPHGLRSTFRDWVGERTHYPGYMVEAALSQTVASAVDAPIGAVTRWRNGAQ